MSQQLKGITKVLDGIVKYQKSLKGELLPIFREILDKPAPKSKNAKKYKCDLCGRGFSRSNTLITHRVSSFLFFCCYRWVCHLDFASSIQRSVFSTECKYQYSTLFTEFFFFSLSLALSTDHLYASFGAREKKTKFYFTGTRMFLSFLW